MISDFLEERKRKVRLEYVYDIGDNWRHELVFTCDSSAASARVTAECVAGGGACPPEDCGGPWGYADLLDAFNAPDDETDEEGLRSRLPEDFDPQAFDVKAAAKRLARLAAN